MEITAIFFSFQQTEVQCQSQKTCFRSLAEMSSTEREDQTVSESMIPLLETTNKSKEDSTENTTSLLPVTVIRDESFRPIS